MLIIAKVAVTNSIVSGALTAITTAQLLQHLSSTSATHIELTGGNSMTAHHKSEAVFSPSQWFYCIS